MRKIKLYIFLLMMVLVTIIWIYNAKITNNRAKIYPYNIQKDYIYDFNQTNAKIVDLKYIDGKIKLPKDDHANKTAFLKVDVEAMFLSKYFQPSIDLKVGEQSVTQYFEHSAKGIRYINISSLMAKGKIEVTLKEKYISINKNTVQLVFFENQDLNNKKILVLAPHPDDAELAAYGLYSDHNESYIITVTAGDCGILNYNEIYQDPVWGYLKKGELRTFDSVTVPLLGGIPSEQMLNLGFFCLKLEDMFYDKSKIVNSLYTKTSDINIYRKQNISSLAKNLSGNSSWNSLVENLKYLLEKIKPDIIVTPYPALDMHPDHKLTTVALIEALKASGIKDGKLYLYLIHSDFSKYYPYGNLGGTISLPPNYDDKIYFDSIYSYSLSSDKQKDKLFALEAMHDLRLDTEWRFTKNAFRFGIKQIKDDVMGRKNFYFRKFVRSNELFFVVDINNIYKNDILKNIEGKLK